MGLQSQGQMDPNQIDILRLVGLFSSLPDRSLSLPSFRVGSENIMRRCPQEGILLFSDAHGPVV